MTENNGFRQFLILMYKGLLLRKRHYICTFFEIVIPVFIASIPAIFLSEDSTDRWIFDETLDSQWKGATIFEPFDPFSPQTVSLYHTNLYHKNYDIRFLYCPANNVTSKFIEEAIARFEKETGELRKLTSKGVRSEKDMELYSLYRQRENRDIIIIGTVLNDFDENVPSSLNYKIRYSDGVTSFRTQLKYQVKGPIRTNVYTDDSFFLVWQAAIEQTFIKIKSVEKGVNIDYKVWMQRFPFPEHRVTYALSYVNSLPRWIGFSFILFMTVLIKRVIEEKVNRSKELLKMMGMTDSVYWISTFANYFVVALPTSFIISIIYKAPLKNSFVVLEFTNFMVLFFLLLMFLSSLILFCMAFSIFFNKRSPLFALGPEKRSNFVD